MASPAATIGCKHICPAYDGPRPHVGGPVLQGSINVFLNGKGACRVGDQNIQFSDLVRNAATNSSTLYAYTRENSSRFFRSTDFGSTWTQITSGITTAVNFIQAGGRIGVTPADPNVVYFEAIGGGGIVHKSIDGGLNFTVSKPEGTGTLAAPYITFYDYNNANTLTGQGNYNNAICVDATDPFQVMDTSTQHLAINR